MERDGKDLPALQRLPGQDVRHKAQPQILPHQGQHQIGGGRLDVRRQRQPIAAVERL